MKDLLLQVCLALHRRQCSAHAFAARYCISNQATKGHLGVCYGPGNWRAAHHTLRHLILPPRSVRASSGAGLQAPLGTGTSPSLWRFVERSAKTAKSSNAAEDTSSSSKPFKLASASNPSLPLLPLLLPTPPLPTRSNRSRLVSAARCRTPVPRSFLEASNDDDEASRVEL